MFHKYNKYLFGCILGLFTIFCAVFVTSQPTSAYTPGKSNCGYFVWDVKVTGDEVDGVTPSDYVSYIKVCAPNLDKNGKIKKKLRPTRVDNTNSTAEYIPMLKQCRAAKKNALCQTDLTQTLTGAQYSYDIGSTKFIDYMNNIYDKMGTYKNKTWVKSTNSKGEEQESNTPVSAVNNAQWGCGDAVCPEESYDTSVVTGNFGAYQDVSTYQQRVYTLRDFTDEQKKCLSEETDSDTTTKCNKPPTDPESVWYVDTSGSTTTGDSSNGNACYGNAGALGWIVCPVTNSAFDALNNIYTEIENKFLKIDAQALFDEDNGVLKAWEAFRNIANIFFIILIIIVILSQLTGLGIDNYGIKKILPKIIVVAVLINLSYIFCQLAVDVSNIIGVSLRDFLANLVTPDYSKAEIHNGMEGWVLAGYAGGITLVVGTALGGLGMIIAILGAAIAGVIAVFFLWLILVIREGGVVLLIALAPLAITCYLLPNTEKLGKRWLDIFKALLLLYPLCSLVIGAGILASNILGSVNDETMRLAAMVVRVVPFFFIPMLLKNSLNAMGNIGAKLSGIGKSVGAKGNAGFRRVANNTNFAKNRQENALRRRTQLANDLLPGSKRTKARRLGVLNAIDEQHKKDALTLWRDSNGNFDLDAVKQAALSDKTDSITRQAALEAWGDAKPDQLAAAIRDNKLNSGALAYVRSNGKLAASIGTQDGRVKEFLKTSGSDYNAWANRGAFDANGQATTNEVLAVQSMSASALAAQDHSVLADQVHRDDGNGNYTNMLSDAQMQSFADNPNLVSSLQRDVRENLDSQLPESTQAQRQAETQAQATAASQATVAAIERSAHQQQARAQGTNAAGWYDAPAGWRRSARNGAIYENPNNPNETYDRRNNTFNVPHPPAS